MILKYTQEGELEWSARIPKDQLVPDESMIKPSLLLPNFLLLSDTENSYLVYKDDTYKLKGKINSSVEQKNPEVKFMGDPDMDGVIVATIDSKGQITREVYSDKDRSKTVFVAKNSWRMKDGRVLVSAKGRKMQRYGFLTLPH